jgi:thiol-disulfide isomerase/thioredoxin
MLPKASDPPLVEGLPALQSIIDSLQMERATVLKTLVQDERVFYAFEETVDWQREFEAFTTDDVNKLRFADNYTVHDSSILGLRTVTFLAKDPSQEVKRMHFEIRSGKIETFTLEKERSNLMSSSRQSFKLKNNTYILSVDQRIDGIFKNTQSVAGEILPAGSLWRCVFDLGGEPMPVQALFQPDQILIKNGDELLRFPKASSEDHDSLIYESAYFNSRFELFPDSDSTLVGRWINDKYDDRRSIPVSMSKGLAYRFSTSRVPALDLSGEHLMLFVDESGQRYDSTVLILRQRGPNISGSILTETGDYRWLDGAARNDSLFLSTMDGTHAYLFKGVIRNDSLIGRFFAGTTWKQHWVGLLGVSHRLRSAHTITRPIPGVEFGFSFPDVNGTTVSLSDSVFQNRVVVISIMGTWCSNCLDEARFVQELQASYESRGVRFVALNFELVSDSSVAKSNMRRYQDRMSISYPILLASLATTKDKASAAMPGINGVFSYPTMIILDRNHEIVRIHTGFSGPATGEARYNQFREEYHALINRLVAAQ